MPKPKTEAATYKPLLVRLPEDVVQCLKADAQKYDRPLNRHLVGILRKLYRDRLPSTSVAAGATP